VFAFIRSIDESDPVFTAVNLSRRTASFTCPVPDDLEGEMLLTTGSVYREKRALRVTLPPWGYVILR
jgi:hypothetical protein